MPAMTFRGCFIRHFDVRRTEGGQFVRIHFTSSFSKPVCEAMDWDPELAKTIESAKLEGRLAATNVILTPNADLAKHEISFAVNDISDFTVVRVAEDGKESKKIELRFSARSQERVAKHLEEYLARIGEGQAALKVSYEEQSNLPLEAPKDSQEDLPLKGPALASHREMSESARAKKKKGELEPTNA